MGALYQACIRDMEERQQVLHSIPIDIHEGITKRGGAGGIPRVQPQRSREYISHAERISAVKRSFHRFQIENDFTLCPRLAVGVKLETRGPGLACTALNGHADGKAYDQCVINVAYACGIDHILNIRLYEYPGSQLKLVVQLQQPFKGLIKGCGLIQIIVEAPIGSDERQDVQGTSREKALIAQAVGRHEANLVKVLGGVAEGGKGREALPVFSVFRVKHLLGQGVDAPGSAFGLARVQKTPPSLDRRPGGGMQAGG